MKQPDFGVVMILIAILTGTPTLFAYCYFGKMSTDSYAKMADCLYECNWIDLSPNLQKYFVIMIGNAQMSINYHGFNITVLNLETFTKTFRAVFSCYMMFKTLTSD